MHSSRLLVALGFFGAVALAGCGSAVSGSPPAPSTTPSGSSSSAAPSKTSSSSSTGVGQGTSVRVTNSQSHSISGEVPLPPGAGSYTGLKAHVDSVVAEGTALINGHTLSVYRVRLTVTNPTSALVILALNDVTASPLGQTPSYSWNDEVTTGLSSANSLFPYPLTPQSPQSTTVNIFPGQSVTGDVTVAVPRASSYAVSWWEQGSSGPILATFTP